MQAQTQTRTPLDDATGAAPAPAQVHAHVRGRVAGLLNLSEAELDDARLLVEYGLNSVDLIDLVAGLEARYDIRFDPATLQAVTCRSLADGVVGALAER